MKKNFEKQFYPMTKMSTVDGKGVIGGTMKDFLDLICRYSNST